MKQLKYIDWFFVLIGLLIIAFGTGAYSENVQAMVVAFGGALIGSAITLMYVRTNKVGKKK